MDDRSKTINDIVHILKTMVRGKSLILKDSDGYVIKFERSTVEPKKRNKFGALIALAVCVCVALATTAIAICSAVK